MKIHLEQITVPEIPRLELYDSKTHELPPVIVRRSGAGYRLLSGARRLRAAYNLGFTEIEAKVYE